MPSIRTTYSQDLARPRRTLQETQACSCQVSKKIKKSNKSRKPKEKPFGPWPSLPSAVFAFSVCPAILMPSAGVYHAAASVLEKVNRNKNGVRSCTLAVHSSRCACCRDHPANGCSAVRTAHQSSDATRCQCHSARDTPALRQA